ncbi:hypothetical protein [Rhizobium gallicum]
MSGFTASLAKEVKPFGVKAIAVEPGSIRTPAVMSRRCCRNTNRPSARS